MKKLLTVLTLIAFVGTASAATSLSTKLSNGLNKLDQKEQALNQKIDNAQAQRAKQKEEAQKKQEAQKKAIEAEKAKIKAQNEANKKAVNEEVGFWKSLFGKK